MLTLSMNELFKLTLGESGSLIIRVVLVHLLELKVAGDVVGLLGVGCWLLDMVHVIMEDGTTY